MSSRWGLLIPIVLVFLLLAGWSVIARRARDTLVVYCTHDLVYAEPILEEFTHRTGIRITLVTDTEATKSLSLTERLLREGRNTPCDLFWNNEVLGTIRLQRKGLLAAYSGTAAQRFPEQFRDPDHQWVGFAGRMRVWIARDNTPQPSAPQATDSDPFPLPRAVSGDHLAIAKPLYGTTFSQFALLWKVEGPEKAKAYHDSLQDRGCRFVAGNAMVRDVVAGGSCDLGMTDTDDVFSALDSGRAVTMEPIRLGGKTICIPNTVALIRGSDRPQEARQLLEYLLSEEVELQLARSARQIPLGKVDPAKIPAEVQPLVNWASESWNVADAADVADDCLRWLKSEYVK